jgi:hypothetical protein
MGTRGSIGFRIDGQDKLTYCQFDSYPEGVGVEILSNLCGKKNWDLIKKRVRKLALVTNEIRPTEAQQAACERFADTGVSEGTLEDWYCLLRQAQGTLQPYLTGKLFYMWNGNNFVLDSVFCEYAYIVNLDDMTLEFYRGFNEDPNEKGRYASLKEPPFTRDDGVVIHSKWYGVRLIDTMPLNSFPPSTRKRDTGPFIDATLERWNKLMRTPEEQAELDEMDGGDETAQATT